jgi:hypothetical protein
LTGQVSATPDNLQAASSLALADDDIETASRLVPRALAMLGEQQRWEDFGRRLRVGALVELRRGLTKRSAVLLGAATRLATDVEFFDELLLPELVSLPEQLKARLGAAAFAEAFGRGERLSVAEVAVALGGR